MHLTIYVATLCIVSGNFDGPILYLRMSIFIRYSFSFTLFELDSTRIIPLRFRIPFVWLVQASKGALLCIFFVGKGGNLRKPMKNMKKTDTTLQSEDKPGQGLKLRTFLM